VGGILLFILLAVFGLAVFNPHSKLNRVLGELPFRKHPKPNE
jgi:hypothetical protein